MKKLVLLLIRFYAKCLSPMKRSCCRFVPTCSAYSYLAVERFGVVKGGFLAFKRILRCHPWSEGGFDPVPQSKPEPN